jgi:hypothetical protein
MDVQEETLGETGMQPLHKEPRPKVAATSRKQEDIQQDLQEGSHAGDHEAKS